MVYKDENKTNRLENIMVINLNSDYEKRASRKDYFLTGLFIGLTTLTILAMVALLTTDFFDF